MTGPRDGRAPVLAVLRHGALRAPATVAAIGARELSPAGIALCRDLGRTLAAHGHTVRTGGAPGADRAYAAAAGAAGGTVQLVLPWPGFAEAPPPPGRAVVTDRTRNGSWFRLAERCRADVHYRAAPPGEREALAARNAGIMLGGAGLGGAPALCVAVTGAGTPSGGTAHALACAAAAGVPAVVLTEPTG